MKLRALLCTGLLSLLLPLAAHAYEGSPAPISNTEGSSRVAALSAGEYHTCALKADGSVACWGAGGPGTSGSRDYGQSTPPAGSFLAVSTGAFHTCALKTDGSVACWGAGGPAPG